MEKAIILRSLLLQAGINAEVAAVIQDLNFDENIGDPAVIESFLVQVNPKKEERIYLSVSQKNDQSMLYNLDGKVVLVLNPAQESMRSFREKGMASAVSLEGQLNILDTARVSGVVTLAATGYRNPFLKLSRNESAVNTLLGGSLKAGSVSSSEFIKRSFEMTETKMVLGETAALKKYGNYLFFDLPYVTGGPDSWGLGLLNTARESALRLPYAFEEHYRFRIALPEGMVLASPQNRIEISNAAGKLVYDLNLDGDVVQVEKSLVVFSAFTELSNYAAFLELTQAWGLQHLKTLIFLAE
jgi:hypothetical protein